MKHPALLLLLTLPFFLPAEDVYFFGLDLRFSSIKTVKKHVFADPLTKEKEFQFLCGNIKKEVSPQLIKELESYRVQYKFEEFAFLELLKKVADKYSPDKNLQKIFLKELILKFGYDACLKSTTGGLFLFARYDQYLQDIYRFTAEDSSAFYCDVYYHRQANAGTFHPLDKENSNAKTIHLSAFHVQLPAVSDTVNIPFIFFVEKEIITFHADTNRISYLRSLPLFPINVNYTDSITSACIIPPLRDFINSKQDWFGRDTIRIVNFLLKFCQQIRYIEDDAAYKMEKHTFPIELLYTGFGDCDDKSNLFAYLVRHYLRKPVYYFVFSKQKHVNTGIDFNTKKDFLYTIEVKGKAMILCDPTCTGYPMGRNPDSCYDKIPTVLLPQ